jgi:hypothetical protein
MGAVLRSFTWNTKTLKSLGENMRRVREQLDESKEKWQLSMFSEAELASLIAFAIEEHRGNLASPSKEVHALAQHIVSRIRDKVLIIKEAITDEQQRNLQGIKHNFHI